MSKRHRIPLFLSALLLASTAGAEDAAGPQSGLVSVEADDGPMVSIQIAASDASAPVTEPVPAPIYAAESPAAATPLQAPAPEEAPVAAEAPAPEEAPYPEEAPAPAQASAPTPAAAPGEEQSAAEQIMSEPSLLPGISYEEALEQMDEWQAYIASQHEAMRKQAEERRALLEQRREEMLKQAKERQEKMIEYYESMYKKAQERRKFLEENQDDFMKEDLERQSGLSEYHQEMLKATEERREELAAKRAELENMPLQDIRAYLAEIRKQTLEDAKSLEMEGVRAPTPPPWSDAPSYESQQGQFGRPGRGWQSSQYGPGGMDYPMRAPGGMDYPMMGPGGMNFPMGPPTELGNPPFGDWGPRSDFPKGGFGRPGMRTGPGMGNPGMGNPGMGNPGMGGPGMGRRGPGPQSSMTPGSAIGQEAAPPPVEPEGNASATNSEPVSWYRRPGGFRPPQFGWAPAYQLPHPAGHRSRTVGAAHSPRHQMAGWRPLPRTFRPRVRHPQLAWWPSRYIPQAAVAANRSGAHPFPIAYAGPRGPLQSGAYPARQIAKRFTPARSAKRLQPTPSFAGNWPYHPYAG